MRSRAHRDGRVQPLGRLRRDVAVASKRDLVLSARLLIAMPGGWSESIAPALMATGLLCLFLPWANRENPGVRAALVAASLIMTWNYLLWRITEPLPQFGMSADWLFGISFLSVELMTGIGGTITWIMLTRSS